MKIIVLKEEVRKALKETAEKLEVSTKTQKANYLESKIAVFSLVEHETIKTVMQTVKEESEKEDAIQEYYIMKTYDQYGLSCGLFLRAYASYLKVSERDILKKA